MTDIVERLRQGIDPLDIPEAERAMDRGADEIDKLRALNRKLVKHDGDAEAVCNSYATENQQFHDKIGLLRAENERLRSDVVVDHMIATEDEIERLRSVIIRYLDFAKDVEVSPVAPELRPIREAMRAAIAEQSTPMKETWAKAAASTAAQTPNAFVEAIRDRKSANWRADNDHYDNTPDGDKDWG